MSVTKAEFAAVVADVKVLKAQNEVLKAEIGALKAGTVASASTKKEKKKRTQNAAQVAAAALKKAWKQHCLDTYEYPSEYTEAEEKALTKTGKKDPLFRNRNVIKFADAMQKDNASDYETFTAKWKADNAPAPVAEESAAEGSAAEGSAAESEAPTPAEEKKPKVSKTKSKEKAPVSDKEASAVEEETPVEEAPKAVPATGRKVIKGSKAAAK
jgi:hypothetical protein